MWVHSLRPSFQVFQKFPFHIKQITFLRIFISNTSTTSSGNKNNKAIPLLSGLDDHFSPLKSSSNHEDFP
jgi:hypothetical protein